MKAKFWDVKEKKSVEAEVIGAVRYENGGYAFKGKTKDGRSLTTFVSKDTYDKCPADLKDACCTPKKGCATAKSCAPKKSCKSKK